MLQELRVEFEDGEKREEANASKPSSITGDFVELVERECRPTSEQVRDLKAMLSMRKGELGCGMETMDSGRLLEMSLWDRLEVIERYCSENPSSYAGHQLLYAVRCHSEATLLGLSGSFQLN